jgi:hypothetical protein
LIHRQLLADFIGGRVDHLQLGLELVDELVARVDRIDGDLRTAIGDLREEIAVARFVRWSTESQEPLHPEPPRSPAVIYDLRKKAG